jgi:hypothetical protein
VSLLLHLLQLLLILEHTMVPLLLLLLVLEWMLGLQMRRLLCLDLLHHRRILSSTNRPARAHLLLLLLLLWLPTLFGLPSHHLLYLLHGLVVDLQLQISDLLRRDPALIPAHLCQQFIHVLLEKCIRARMISLGVDWVRWYQSLMQYISTLKLLLLLQMLLLLRRHTIRKLGVLSLILGELLLVM